MYKNVETLELGFLYKIGNHFPRPGFVCDGFLATKGWLMFNLAEVFEGYTGSIKAY
jgi:hypothetical protein